MITEKEVRIITQNQGFILSVKKAYEGKAFPFAVTCTLPITFNYQKDSYIHLSYVIETPKENYKFSEGKMDKNKPYTSYTVVVKSRYAEIVNLVTPKQLRKRGFASAILDIVSEIITEYNSLITTQKFMQLKEYTTIKFITGYAIPVVRINEFLSKYI